MAKIILASSSPRRIELFRNIGLEKVKVIAPDVDEKTSLSMPPEDLVAHWAQKKAEAVSALVGPEDIVVAADTMVHFDGNILGKPEDEADAFRMLTLLSGSWHTVYTGVTVRQGTEALTEIEATSVLIRSLSGEQIESYIETGEPLDKAGAYGIQGRGSLLVERIEGDFFNVMGLPVYRTSLILERFGIDLFRV